MKNVFILTIPVTLSIGLLMLCGVGCHLRLNPPDKWPEYKSSLEHDTDIKNMWLELEKRPIGFSLYALETAEKIYRKAQKIYDVGEIVKALIYKFRILKFGKNNAFEKALNMLEAEIKVNSFPVKPVLHSILAREYWEYYVDNREELLGRTALAVPAKPGDIQTWDARKIVEKVIEHYDNSLENPQQLKKTSIDWFNNIIIKGENFRLYSPTLYDFLARQAIDFYMDHEADLTLPQPPFNLNNHDYFSNSETFARMEIPSPGSFSFHYHALKYFQDLVRFHLAEKNFEALVDIEMKRLEFVYQNSGLNDKDILYTRALQYLVDTYENHLFTADIYHSLADLYRQLGEQYSPGKHEDYKTFYRQAFRVCQKAMKKFADSCQGEWFHWLAAKIRKKELTLELEIAVVPNKPFKVLLRYRNIPVVYFKVIKISPEDHLSLEQRRFKGSNYLSKMLKRKEEKKWQVNLPKDDDFRFHSVEVKVDGLEKGEYLLAASFTPGFDTKDDTAAFQGFSVTNISYISRQNAGEWEFLLLHRETGKPLTGAKAYVWYMPFHISQPDYDEKKAQCFPADDNGRFRIPSPTEVISDRFFLTFSHGSDRFYPGSGFGFRSSCPGKNTKTFFFTDRAIYRPGQMVYFKGIMLERDKREGEKSRILPHYQTRVTLYDVNNQQVSQLDLKTNQYGTFSGTFALPVGRLNGNMTISNDHGVVGFLVEEYKRPKFRVDFHPLKKTYRLHDTVSVKGEARAYAGYAITNAAVKYRVQRRVFYPYRRYVYYTYYLDRYNAIYRDTPDIEITNGTTQTNARGEFELTFNAIPDLSIPENTEPAFQYTIYADVTDINGETRSSQMQVSIGYKALELDVEIPGHLDKDRKTYAFELRTTNLDGEFVPKTGSITVYKLKTPGRIYRPRAWDKPDRFLLDKTTYYSLFPLDIYDSEDDVSQWQQEKKVFSQTFDTGKTKQLNLSELHRWQTGKYALEMRALDGFGKEVKITRYFTLFSGHGKHMPYKMLSWFSIDKTKAEPGEKAVVYIGSSERNVRVLYELESRGRIIKSQYLVLNDEQKHIIIPIKEEYRGTLGVHVTFVRHNRLVNHEGKIVVPWSNKHLDISFETFRNKLIPGEKEQWRLKIRGPAGEKVAAEMIAALYDASLDAFCDHEWQFNVFPYHGLTLHWNSNRHFRTGTDTAFEPDIPEEGCPLALRKYDRLNLFRFPRVDRDIEFGFDFGIEGGIEGGVEGGVVGGVLGAPGIAGKLEEEQPPDYGNQGLEDEGKPVDREKKFPIPGLKAVKIRSDFKETAFFYPHLETTPDGEIVISFTIPDALTKWKMMGFAHSKNLEYGFVFNELVTQKDLMVVPNPPRFFRVGDALEFTAKVVNLSNKMLQGTAQLQLFDAVTMQPKDALCKNRHQEKPFEVEPGQSTVVSWKIKIPEDLDALTYRLTARAGRFTDGEEQVVPILENRLLVTESLPLPIPGKQTKSFTFKKLVNAPASKTLKHHCLTLEFTPNPAWYVVQALPYLMEFPHECMEQTFNRYYASIISAYIVKTHPLIRRVLEIWKTAQTSKESPHANALLSNLEKNQELKTLLLEETPWLLDAQDETERKRRTALLMDFNNASARIEPALNLLKEGQLSSGAWPWFCGMNESRYITQYIICGFAHLEFLKVMEVRKNREVWNMIKKAVIYLDEQLNEDYQWLLRNRKKQELKKNQLRSLQVYYLYARSYFKDIPIDDRNMEAFTYYKSQVKTYWKDFDWSYYLQGMMALALKHYGDSETAETIMKYIKSWCFSSEEMGMYWVGQGGYLWYQAPIETQALLIEAFDQVLHDKESVKQMKTWLLKQKQTLDWRTTKATAEACYALLLTGEDWLAENQPPNIVLGKKNPMTVKLKESNGNEEQTCIKAEAGTGYFKTAWTGKSVTPDMGYITVKNNNKVPAWGSLYWQYFENLDKITAAKTPLRVEKTLLVEKQSPAGPILVPIGNTSLKVGDRIIVCIRIKVGRDMEYVHMKDMRASTLEPETVISRCYWQGGLRYYQSSKDASTHFFFDYLSKGTYQFEYPLRVTHAGDFSNGITIIQCMYAPEFSSHSTGIHIKVHPSIFGGV
jgi:uncharacterized protein YfaS (alpha-2-macroglobulin family)